MPDTNPKASDVEALYAGLSSHGSYTVAAAFRAAAETAAGDSSERWQLLADVVTMGLTPVSAAQPFRPAFQDSQGNRTMLPADLTSAHLDFLSQLLTGLCSPELTSRVGDVLWVARKDGAAARRAVPAYLEAGRQQETSDGWVVALECYERAVRLAALLGKRNAQLDGALSFISDRALAAGLVEIGHFGYSLLSLLFEFRFGEARLYASFALTTADDFLNGSELEEAARFFGLAARYLDRASDTAAADDARRRKAETLVLQAEAQERITGPAFAQHHWEQAIEAWRAVPESKARLPELQQRLTACGQEALKLMKPIQTQIDIQELVEFARSHVLGRTLPDAICALASVEEPPQPEKVRKSVMEGTQRSFLSNMFSQSTYDRQGRVVDRRPGLFGAEGEQWEQAIDGLMQRDVDMRRGLEVSGCIGPGLEALLEEHVVEADDLEDILHGSTFIPELRMDVFVQGLAAGFRWDLMTAAHLLMPQIEHAIRQLLVSEGIIPTSLTADMLQQEWGLGRMLDHSALNDVIGADMVQALRRLLVVPGGPNLRNRLAHGMLEPREMKTSPVLYFWWLVLKLSLCGTAALGAHVVSNDD